MKDGFFFRKDDSRKIQRLKCQCCGNRFSKATFAPEYNQKKRRVNEQILRDLSSSTSQNRIALNLGINPKTVARKLLFLGEKCKALNAKLQSEHPKVQDVLFDELITIEHTKCKPLSVAMAVEDGTRRILGFEVSQTPATGHLAAIARQKYGQRKCQRKRGLTRLFRKVKPALAENLNLISDQYPTYESVVEKELKKGNQFTSVHYQQFKGRKASVAGQGELKIGARDPLFSINHTFAMLRDGIKRLVRKSWCTTKRKENLVHHLHIYTYFHNSKLI